MERAEYRGLACLHFVEAMPIAAGRAGWGGVILLEELWLIVIILLRRFTPPPLF